MVDLERFKVLWNEIWQVGASPDTLGQFDQLVYDAVSEIKELRKIKAAALALLEVDRSEQADAMDVLYNALGWTVNPPGVKSRIDTKEQKNAPRN